MYIIWHNIHKKIKTRLNKVLVLYLQDVVTFTLINGTNSGVDYFFLDRDNGQVSVRRDLVRSPFISEYIVSSSQLFYFTMHFISFIFPIINIYVVPYIKFLIPCHVVGRGLEECTLSVRPSFCP